MKHLVNIFLFVLSALFVSFEAGAQQSAPNPTQSSDTVGNLIAEALTKNPELRVAAAEVAAAKGERTQAGLWKNPELSVDYGERRVTDAEANLAGEGITRGISLAQTFEFPGKGSLRKAIANRNIEIAELGLKQFQLALAGRIRQLCYRYWIAKANAERAKEISDRSSDLIDLLARRPTAGVQALLDTRIIQGSVVEIDQAAREFDKDRIEAMTELNGLLGRRANQPLNVTVSLDVPTNKMEVEVLIFTALGRNFQLKARERELERAAGQVDAAKLDAAPDFTVGPFYSQDRAADIETNIGIAVSVPLPLWNWNQGNVETAEAHHEQTEAMLQQARNEVEKEVVRRSAAYESALKQLRSTPLSFLEDMRKAADLADRQYRLGAVPVQTYVEMQQQYLSVSRTLNEALLTTQESMLDLQLLTADSIEGLDHKTTASGGNR